MSSPSYIPEDHPWEFYPPTPVPVDSCPPIYYDPSPDPKQKPRANYLSIIVLVLLIVCLLAFVAAIGGIIGRYFLTGATVSGDSGEKGGSTGVTTECPCDLSQAGWHQGSPEKGSGGHERTQSGQPNQVESGQGRNQGQNRVNTAGVFSGNPPDHGGTPPSSNQGGRPEDTWQNRPHGGGSGTYPGNVNSRTPNPGRGRGPNTNTAIDRRPVNIPDHNRGQGVITRIPPDQKARPPSHSSREPNTNVQETGGERQGNHQTSTHVQVGDRYVPQPNGNNNNVRPGTSKVQKPPASTSNTRPGTNHGTDEENGWIRFGSTEPDQAVLKHQQKTTKQPTSQETSTQRSRIRPDFVLPPPGRAKTTTTPPPRSTLRRPTTTPQPTTPMTTTRRRQPSTSSTSTTTRRPPPRPTPPPLTADDRKRIEESIRRSQQKDQSKSKENHQEPLITRAPLTTPQPPGTTTPEPESRQARDSRRTNALLYRIPRQKMHPLHYDVTMQVHGEDRIEGIVSIAMKIGESTKTVGLHAADIHVQSVHVTDPTYSASGKTGVIANYEDMYGRKGSWGIDPLHETLTIRTTSTLEAGKTYNITVRYDITIRNNLAINVDTSNTVITWATKLEPTYARFLMPCIDDPAMKASFATKIIHRAVDNNTVLANEDLCKRTTLNGWNIDEFCKTPVMTTYNFAIVYGNFISLCDYTSSRVRICIWLAPEYQESLQYALHTAIDTFNRAQHYFHVPYKMSKLDFVGVANYPSAAMENWGLIVHHVTMLALQGTPRKEAIEDIITHEVAHQWFGNLISLSWWDDIWVNEGFAQFFTTYFRQHDRPVEARNTYFNYFLHTMRAQGIPGLAEPLVKNHTNPFALSESFVQLGFLNVYSKGAYMVSMIHELTLEGRFRNAIVDTLQRYALQSVDRYQVLDAFQPYSRVHKKMTEIMVPWLENPGYPEVHIWRNITSGEMILYQYPANQYRYNDFPGKIDKSIDESLFWPIPVTYQTKWAKAEEQKSQIYWLTEASQEFVLPEFGVTEWIVLNPGFKYMYRISYDELTMELLMAQLREDHTVIPPESRVQFMFDALYFFKYSDTRFIQLLDLLGYMEQETDVLPLLTGIDVLSEIFIAFKDSSLFPLLQIQFSPAIFQIFEIYRSIRGEDQHKNVIARHGVHVCRLICAIGHPHCEGFAKHGNLSITADRLGRITGEPTCEYIYLNRRVLHYTEDEEFEELLKSMRDPGYFESSLNPTAFYICILCAPNRYFVQEVFKLLHEAGELSAGLNYALNYHHLTFEPCPYMYSELWRFLSSPGSEAYRDIFADTSYRFTQGVGLSNALRKLDQVATARNILPKTLAPTLDFTQGRIEWIERNENKLARDLHKRLKTPHWKTRRRSFG